MSFSHLITALALPPDARVDQRVPKKLLVERAAPTGTDKRQIQEGIEEVVWVAALKPTNVAVPAFRDELREYIEIAVLTATFRSAAKSNRLIELIHRAVPYPLLLVAAHDDGISLSLAHKRWSKGDAEKIVIEDIHCTAPFRFDPAPPEVSQFLEGLAISRQPSRDLFALYQGWLDLVTAFEVARITGIFSAPDSVERAASLREGLNSHAVLQRDIAALRARAEKEKQLSRRVELNLEIKRKEAELASLTQAL